MRKLLILVIILLITQANYAQFNRSLWEIKLGNSSKTVFLKQNGNKVLAPSSTLSASWNPSSNKLKGFFILDKKKYNFEAYFKNTRLKRILIGKCFPAKGKKVSKTFVLLRKKKSHTVAKKKKGYNGKYRVTVTNLYTDLSETHAVGIFDNVVEMYGTIGIRVYGKSKSGEVDVRSVNNKKPRIWDVSKKNPKDIKQQEFKSKTISDLTGKKFKAFGILEIDKMREFNIQGEIANENLIVNIQSNISESDAISDTKLGWKQRSLYIKSLTLGKEYLLINRKNKHTAIAVGFIVEKF